MDETELAFAGIARQAELIREGDGLLARARRSPARADRADRSPAEQLPGRPRRAGPRGGRRGRSPGCRGRERAAARRAGRAQGRGRRRRRADHARQRRLRPARRRRLGAVPAPARGGRRADRQDDPLRAGDLAVHRDRGVGRDPQPLGSVAHLRRLQRRLRRRGGGGPRRRRLGLRRRRVDPDPGRATTGSSG